MKPSAIFSTVVMAVLLAVPSIARAGDDGGKATEQELQRLQDQLKAQQKRIDELQAELQDQAKKQSTISSQIDAYVAKDGAGSWFEEPNTMRAYYKGGLNFETSDKKFTANIGGRLLADDGFARADRSMERAFGSFSDRTEFRQTWLHAKGTFDGHFAYMFQVSLTGGKVIPRFMWIGLTHLPVVGRIRVGNFKEPFGLEKLTPFKYLTFLERGLPDVFPAGFRMGVDVGNTVMGGKLTWALGLFHNTSATGSGPTGKNITGRIAFAPILEDHGRTVLHLGFDYSRRYPGTERFHTPPEDHTAPTTLDTGSFPVDSENRFDFEAAAVLGSFSAQGEYMLATTSSSAAGNPTLSGYYVFVSYFLTGEHRTYKNGVFSRLTPKANFLAGEEGGGSGAVELVARLSHLSLDSGNLYTKVVETESGRRRVDLAGGSETNWTFGVNWYPNPATRFMLDYVLGHVSGVGHMRAILMRMQVEF